MTISLSVTADGSQLVARALRLRLFLECGQHVRLPATAASAGGAELGGTSGMIVDNVVCHSGRFAALFLNPGRHRVLRHLGIHS